MTPRQRARMVPWQGAANAPRKWQALALPAVMQAIRRSRPDAPVRPLVSAVMGAGKSVLIAELAFIALHGRAMEEDTILVAAPRQNLVKQLSKTVKDRCGRETVGVYYQHGKQPARPIVVCCYQSLPGLVDELVQLGRRICLFIGDEAHRTECETILQTWQRMTPLSAVGVTATPYRADERERLSLWTEVVYRYTLDEAWRDGVLVPYRRLCVSKAWVDAGEVGIEGTDALDQACLRLIVEAQTQGLDLFPMISSAYDIEDAEHFRDVLQVAGISAVVVHSKQSQAKNDAAIGALQRGEARVLVQVTMLSEGSDFPWLRGLLLRRDIASAVLFFQFMGRGLRANTGKAYCTMLDPHRLFDAFGVSRPEALGEAMEEALREAVGREEEAEDSEKSRTVRVSFVEDVEAWTADLLLRMQAADLYQRGDYQGREGWRGTTATKKQIGALARMKWAVRYLPEHVRKAVRELCDQGQDLPAGAVSDLLNVLFALARCTQETRDKARLFAEERGSYAGAPLWTWPEHVEVPPCPGAPKEIRDQRRVADKIEKLVRLRDGATSDGERASADAAIARWTARARKTA